MFIPRGIKFQRPRDETFAVILAFEVFLLFAVTAAMIFFRHQVTGKRKTPL